MVSVEIEADKGYDTGFPVLENWPRLSKGIKRQGKKKKSCSCFFFELCASLFYLSVSVSRSLILSYLPLHEPRNTLPGPWRQASLNHVPFTVQKTVSRTRSANCFCQLPIPSSLVCVSSEPCSRGGSECLGWLRFLPGETQDHCSEDTIQPQSPGVTVRRTPVPPTTCRPPPVANPVTLILCGTQLGSGARGTS